MASATEKLRNVLPDTGGNPVTWILYRLAYPFALAASRTGISANAVSLLSLLLAFGAVVALVIVDSTLGFSFLWASSVLLDFADGTVARMAGRANRSAFRLDHTLDLVKLGVGVTGLALYWDSKPLWVLASSTSIAILLFTLLNHDLAYANAAHGQRPTRQRLSRTSWRRTFLVPMLTIHGGTVLLLSLAPINRAMTYSVLTYLCILSSALAVRNAAYLHGLPKPKMGNHGPTLRNPAG